MSMPRGYISDVETVNKNIQIPKDILAKFEKARDKSGIEHISEFVRRTLEAYVIQSEEGQVRWPPVFIMVKPVKLSEYYGEDEIK